MTSTLLDATALTKSFVTGRDLLGRPRGWTYAVNGVDLQVAAGETVAVVGESGAGKSTLGRLVLRLIEPDGGTIHLDGTDVRAESHKQMRVLRKRMQMIFQDPYSSLDPRMVIEDAVGEPLRVHFGMKGVDLRRQTMDLLDRVGISQMQAERYPHEFSGGQLQRIAIARALAVEPDLVVCDEPVAALDVSIRAQVINLLHDLQQERGVAYIFISHDLSLVRLISDRILVMYQGKVVEEADPATLYASPRHPYTRDLLDVIPVPDPRRRRQETDRDSRPDEITEGATSAGCNYAPRCQYAEQRCSTEAPELRVVAGGRRVSCHFDLPDLSGGAESPEARPIEHSVVER